MQISDEPLCVRLTFQHKTGDQQQGTSGVLVLWPKVLLNSLPGPVKSLLLSVLFMLNFQAVLLHARLMPRLFVLCMAGTIVHSGSHLLSTYLPARRLLHSGEEELLRGLRRGGALPAVSKRQSCREWGHVSRSGWLGRAAEECGLVLLQASGAGFSPHACSGGLCGLMLFTFASKKSILD